VLALLAALSGAILLLLLARLLAAALLLAGVSGWVDCPAAVGLGVQRASGSDSFCILPTVCSKTALRYSPGPAGK